MSTAEKLAELRRMVTEAKSVPMSASCMLNRADVLSLIDDATRELEAELAESRAIVASRHEEVARGRDDGDRIRQEAEEWARNLAGQTEVVSRAQRMAEELQETSRQEAEAMKAEADAYVDQRMAEFEAALQKTQTQVHTMRERLADRTLLSEETTKLPRVYE